MSDPVAAPPTLEDRVGDLAAVLDAAESERAAILGFSEGATVGFLYAASAPARVAAVIAYGEIILGVGHAERPWGVREETYSSCSPRPTNGATEKRWVCLPPRSFPAASAGVGRDRA